jgi:hypothetical protein
MRLTDKQIEQLRSEWWGRAGTIGTQGDAFYSDICPVCGALVQNKYLHQDWHLSESE